MDEVSVFSCDIYPDFGRLGGTRVEGGGGVDDTI